MILHNYFTCSSVLLQPNPRDSGFRWSADFKTAFSNTSFKQLYMHVFCNILQIVFYLHFTLNYITVYLYNNT